MATLSAQVEAYPRAIELFMQVASASIDNNLLRFSVKACAVVVLKRIINKPAVRAQQRVAGLVTAL